MLHVKVILFLCNLNLMLVFLVKVPTVSYFTISDCVPLPCIPSGTWYCKYCQNVFQKDWHGQHEVNALAAAGRIAGPDILELMNKRCIRVVRTLEVDHGGCALCRYFCAIYLFIVKSGKLYIDSRYIMYKFEFLLYGLMHEI